MFTLTHVWSVNTPERSESVWFPFKRHVWVKQTTNALQVQCLSSQHELRAHKHTFAAYLYFHGHLPAVLHPRQVNLADGRRRKRTLLEGLQLVPPVRTQVAVQRFLQTHTHTHTNRCYFCSLSFFQVNIPSSPDLKRILLYHSIMMKEEIRTVICLIGMKSALCLTRSKILASWGLMKASSEIKKHATLLRGER